MIRFVPFCGIALQPTAEPENSADQQDKTVAVNQTDLADVLPPTDSVNAENSAGSNISDEISAPVEESFYSNDKEETEQKTEIEKPEETGQSEADSLPYDATLVDIPRPQVLTGEEKAEEKDESAEVNSKIKFKNRPKPDKKKLNHRKLPLNLLRTKKILPIFL